MTSTSAQPIPLTLMLILLTLPTQSNKLPSYVCTEVLIVEYRGEKEFITQDVVIPVPPNTSHQLSKLLNVSPPPSQVIRRGDNLLLRFRIHLKRFQRLYLRISCKLTIRNNSASAKLRDIPFSRYLQDVSEDPQALRYLAPTRWWNYTATTITSAVQKLKRHILTNSSLADVIHDLYHWICTHMRYIKTKLRKGAVKALEENEGDCSEFSDVFIALARALKMPTRRIWGWVITNPIGDRFAYVGHAWVEIWIPSLPGWVPLEVTGWNSSLRIGAQYFPNYIAFYIEDGVHESKLTLVPPNETFLLGSEEWIPLGDGLWLFSTIVIRPSFAPERGAMLSRLATGLAIAFGGLICASTVLYCLIRTVKRDRE